MLHHSSASAYGSLMLIGEHSVLHHAKAVVSATKQQLQASISPRDDKQISIQSHLGNLCFPINHIPQNHTFKFALASIAYCYEHLHLHQGFNIHYHSTIPTTIGMGSSAATVAATVKALYQFVNQTIDQHTLWKHCKSIVVQTQGRGSGADLCAAIYGGVCVFTATQGWLKHISSSLLQTFNWQLHYCGYKTTTDEVLKITQKFEQASPKKSQQIYQKMAQLTEEFITALIQQDSLKLALAMNRYQQQMVALHISDSTLNEMINSLYQHPSILGAKISGSGLGDCILSFGTPDSNTVLPKYTNYHINF